MNKQSDDSITSQIPLSRLQRRQIKKLADKIDRITQADRLFFERRPYRLIASGSPGRPRSSSRSSSTEAAEDPAGFRLFAIVRNVAPGAQDALFLGGAGEGGD